MSSVGHGVGWWAPILSQPPLGPLRRMMTNPHHQLGLHTLILTLGLQLKIKYFMISKLYLIFWFMISLISQYWDDVVCVGFWEWCCVLVVWCKVGLLSRFGQLWAEVTSHRVRERSVSFWPVPPAHAFKFTYQPGNIHHPYLSVWCMSGDRK